VHRGKVGGETDKGGFRHVCFCPWKMCVRTLMCALGHVYSWREKDCGYGGICVWGTGTGGGRARWREMGKGDRFAGKRWARKSRLKEVGGIGQRVILKW
jgi:hypothetical protein